MTTKERIITSVRTANGAYMDGSYAKEMLNQTKDTGITVRKFMQIKPTSESQY